MDQLISRVKLDETEAVNFTPDAEAGFHRCKLLTYQHTPVMIRYPEDIFRNNDIELRKDFNLLTKGRESSGYQPN